MKKIRPFPVPLKSRSLEYLTSDRKKVRRSNLTGPKLVQNSSRGKWKGRKTPPSSAFRFVRVPRCNIEMIYIFVGCQWPPKSCTVRLPYYHFLFFFLCSSVIITIPSAYAGWKWRETESMQTRKVKVWISTDHVEIRNEGMMRQWWRNGEPIGMIAEMKGW